MLPLIRCSANVTIGVVGGLVAHTSNSVLTVNAVASVVAKARCLPMCGARSICRPPDRPRTWRRTHDGHPVARM